MNEKIKNLKTKIVPVCAISLIVFSMPIMAQGSDAGSTTRDMDLIGVDNTLKKVSEKKANLEMRRINYEMEKMDIDLEKLRNEAQAEDPSQNNEQQRQIEQMRAELERRSMQLQQQQAGLSTDQQTGFRGVAVTSVYGVGEKVIAEVRVNDNRIVASRGTVLPNGEKVTDVSSSGITVKQSNGKSKSYGVTGNLSTLANYNQMGPAMPNASGRFGTPRF